MKKICKTKKSMGHIEVIISFSIFIGFIIFLVIILNPLKQQGLSYSLLEVIEYEILNNFSSVVKIRTLKIGGNIVNGECFELDKNLINSSFIAKNFSGEIMNTSIGANYVYIENQGGTYTLYYSEILDTYGTLQVGGCVRTDYNISAVSSITFISEKRIHELNESYSENYENLKESFNFPANNDFSFMIQNTQREEIVAAKKEIPGGINVLAREIPITIIDPNATSYSGFLNLRVW